MHCSRCGASIEGTPSYCPNCGAPVTVAAMPAAATGGVIAGAMPVAPGEVRYGGFWRRFGAAFIDSLLLQIASFPVAMIAMVPMSTSFESFAGEDMSPEQIGAVFSTYTLLGLVGLIMSWLYFALLESSPRRATVGKMACGIVVTDLSGRRLSFARATGRFFASMLSSLTLGIGYLLMFFTERRQTLHDLVAGTLVLRRN